MDRISIVRATCSEEGCNEVVKARGRCRKHYNRWLAVRPDGERCSIDSCKNVSFIKGICQKHYCRAAYEKKCKKLCSVDGCGRVLLSMGMCKTHRDENYKHKTVTSRRITPFLKIKDILTSGQVAKICNVDRRTVRMWIDGGTLLGYRITVDGERRVSKEELIRFMKEYDFPVFIEAKKCIVLAVFGEIEIDLESAEIAKKMIEEIGFVVHVCKDGFSSGLVIGKTKPHIIFVDCDKVGNHMPMLIAMSSSSDVIVATSDTEISKYSREFSELGIYAISKPYKIKTIIDEIAKHDLRTVQK